MGLEPGGVGRGQTLGDHIDRLLCTGLRDLTSEREEVGVPVGVENLG